MQHGLTVAMVGIPWMIIITRMQEISEVSIQFVSIVQ